MATLDFNRDGQLDFVITQIGEPSALVVNQTNSGHHWLQVSLVRTKTERDAIGASIEVHVGDQAVTGWNVTGDGYLCRNENVVCFGLGEASMVERLQVRWPDGQLQTFRDVSANQRLLIIEGDSSIFALQ